MSVGIAPEILRFLDISDLQPAGLGPWLSERLELCARLFKATGVSAFLSVADEPGVFRVAAVAGSHATVPPGATVSLGEGLAGSVLEIGEPMIVDDPERHPVFAARGLSKRPGLGCAMLLPLVGTDGERHGIVSLSRRSGEPHFGHDDLGLAVSLTSVVGLAVANARLVGRLEETHRLKRLAELGQMAAAVAHEIRNPLTGIRGAAQLLAENPGSLPQAVEIVASETDRIDRLCEEFLILARPLRLRREPATLSQAVEGAVFAARASVRGRDVTVEWEPGREPLVVEIDIDRVRQAADNLILNALQAVAPGGRVRVSVEGTVLSVEDDGAGMDAATLERLFSPFYTTKADGTGLGLVNVRRIVDAHGGEIAVRSEPGRGTRIELAFPRSAA